MIELYEWILIMVSSILGWELARNDWRFFRKCLGCGKREKLWHNNYAKINKDVYHYECFKKKRLKI